MKDFILIVLGLCFCGCVFLMLRNLYTFERTMFASKLVSNYTSYLIWETDNYEMNGRYFEKFEVDYTEHLFNIFLWGKYSAIKPEYIELLKQYEDYDEEKAKMEFNQRIDTKIKESFKKIEDLGKKT